MTAPRTPEGLVAAPRTMEGLVAAPRTMEGLVAARAGERDEMRGLTDRLAALVGKVRGLEAQNMVLRVRVTESREERREREEVSVSCHREERGGLEAEREELGRSLGELQAGLGSLLEENCQLRAAVAQREEALDRLAKTHTTLQREAQRLRSCIVLQQQACREGQGELLARRKELLQLDRRVTSSVRDVKEVREVVRRREEEGKEQVEKRRREEEALEELLEEEYRTRDESAVHHSVTGGLESSLSLCLTSLRLQYGAGLAASAAKYDAHFFDCLHVLQSLVCRERTLARVKALLHTESRAQVVELEGRVVGLEKEGSRLAKEVRAGVERLAELEGINQLEVGEEREIQELEERLEEQRRAEQEVREETVLLGLEIGLYRVLLEQGELGVEDQLPGKEMHG